MPAPPRTSVSGVSADNIIAGGRKRQKLEPEHSNGLYSSPTSSTSRLPDASSEDAVAASEEASRLGFKLLDVLINRFDEDNTPLSVPFLALPSKTDYPDYYEIVKNPISLEQIRRRLQNRQFATFEQVRNAFESVCRNAKRYNVKGSEIYEKSRVMHQIILHAYVDLVEKGDVQPVGDLILKSEPSLEQQSAQLGKIERLSNRARLDYDELEGQEVVGRVSLRLKKNDDIDYEEDDEGGENIIEEEESVEERQEKTETPVQTTDVEESKGEAKAERNTPQIEAATDMEVDEGDDMDGDLSSAPLTFDGDMDVQDGKNLDKSMLTLSGKFDRRKRPGPRGKRLKSTLRHLVGELKNAVDQRGQPITRFFLTLPSRLQYPDYYKVIQRPIALDSIEDKVMNKDYINPFALITDLRQMVENAQYYNEEGSEVWEAAEEVRQYVEGTTIPTLLADGFTLDPNDQRQSAMPVDIADNSTIPSQAAAFRIQSERRIALENGTSTEIIESVSPEIPSRTLATPNDKLKVRLSTRSNHASTSPGPLGDLQPPIPAPSSAGLGLSVNDGNQYRMGAPRNSYNNTLTSPGAVNYSTPPSLPATPSSYLGNTNHSQTSPANVLPWATTPGNGSLSHASPNSSTYFGQQYQSGLNYVPHGSGRQTSSSAMAPPGGAAYANGSLPFQRPTNVQMQQQQQQQGLQDTNATLNVQHGGTPSRSSPLLSKRLPGEPPIFDPFQTNALQLSPESTIIRQAVISQFDIKVQSKESGKEKMVYKLKNDVTRIHSISILSGPSEQLQFQVEMTPAKIVQKGDGEKENEADDRRWTVSIHHNGKGIKPQWKGEEINGIKAHDESNTISSSSTRVQVPAGSLCRFEFAPQSGANIVNVHIHPPPPNSALQEIVRDERHPLRSKAKALLDLPERYRILVYCRS